jgi:hypothetical protein
LILQGKNMLTEGLIVCIWQYDEHGDDDLTLSVLMIRLETNTIVCIDLILRNFF